MPDLLPRPDRLDPLDRRALLRWLESDAVVDARGRVWSWHNPAHPGYAYPEAGGLWLALMARAPEADDALLDSVARWLLDRERHGALGRDPRVYLFDRGMVLAGWLAWAERRGRPASAPERRLLRVIRDELQAGWATSPPLDSPRWSARFGPHLLKLARPLYAWWARDPDADADARRRALASLWSSVGLILDEGRVIGSRRTGPTGPTYLHAHCYAAEGLWQLSRALPSPLGDELDALARRSVDWLAQVQRPDGGLPPWHDGRRGWGPAPADVAAQAVRLWSGLDRRRHRAAIDRALGFLARLRHPQGGIRYHEGSEDQNSWATIFTVQAVEFAGGPADVTALV